jgi:drug/metabolite transporter (DMT)-like permease
MLPNFTSYARAPLGLFWGLLAAICWAIGTFIVKRTDWGAMRLSLTFWQVAITLPPVVLGMILMDGLPDHWPTTPALLVMLYTGTLPMAFGTLVWFTLVRLLPTQVAALSSIAIPIVAIVSGVVFLHEPLSTLQAVAIASTVLSLWLALVPSRSV